MCELSIQIVLFHKAHMVHSTTYIVIKEFIFTDILISVANFSAGEIKDLFYLSPKCATIAMQLLYHLPTLHETLHCQKEFPSTVFEYCEGCWGRTPEKKEIWGFRCAILSHFQFQLLEFTDISLQYLKLRRFLIY